MWPIVCFPIFPAMAKIIVLVFAFTVNIHLTLEIKTLSCNDLLILRILKAYNLFALIWAIFFISALAEMALAGTFATWYWMFDKAEVSSFAVVTALKTSMKYHSGTVALGSIPMINIFRNLPMIYKENAPLSSFCLWILYGLGSLLQRFDRYAYIMCFVDGRRLRSSALSGYRLISRSKVRSIALDIMAMIVHKICRVLLVIGIGVMVYLYLYIGGNWTKDQELWLVIPIIILAIGALMITGEIVGVYSIAVDTIAVCFRKCTQIV